MKYRASDNVLATTLADGSGVLLDLASSFYFTLNDTGITAWRWIEQAPNRTADAESVARVLVADYETSPEAARADATTWLESLRLQGLVERVEG